MSNPQLACIRYMKDPRPLVTWRMGRAGLLVLVVCCAVMFIVDGVMLVLGYEREGSTIHKSLSAASSLVVRGWQSKGKWTSSGWFEVTFGALLFSLAGLLVLVEWDAFMDTRHFIVSQGVGAREIGSCD